MSDVTTAVPTSGGSQKISQISEAIIRIAGNSQVKHFGDETEGENIFPLVLRRAADGLDGQAGNRYGNVMIFFLPFRIHLDMIGIKKHDTAHDFWRAVDLSSANWLRRSIELRGRG